MADNVIANPGSGGAQFRAFSDGTNEWPASIVAYVTGGSAGAWTLQQVDTTHGLPVAVLGTVPVSGTFFQATQPVSIAATINTSAAQSGTWNVTVNTALPAGSATIGGVELVDSAGTNKASISAAGAVKVDGSAVTQPVSGTFWQATQPVSGTVTANAGTGTFTISGTVTANAGSGTFTVTDAALELAQASTTSGQKGPLMQGAVTTAAPTYTTAQTNPLSLTTAGALRVDGSAVTQPVSGTFWQATQPVSGTVTANIGTSGSLALDATLTGGSQKAIPVAGTTGGATPYHLVSAASTNATSVKASAGTVYSVQAFNTNASARYLKFYDKASAPTVGTDTPKKVIMMPGNASGAGATATFPVGVVFSSGIAIAITGGIADSDNTAVGASDCIVNFDYA